MFKRMCMDLYPKCIYSGGYNIILGQRAFTNTEIFTYNRLLNPGNVLRKVLWWLNLCVNLIGPQCVDWMEVSRWG